MVTGMFCVMVTGIIWLVAYPREEQARFENAVSLIYSDLDKRQQERPVTADMLEMMRLYGEVQSIIPDSLTAQDSAFLHDIDKQLNRILYE